MPFLTALRDGRLKPFSELNDGFMRPDYPEQVVLSYFQASLVFEVIEDRYGFDAIRRMLAGYRDGETTEGLFESVLGVSLEDFDDDFDDWLRDRFEKPLQGVLQMREAPGPSADIEAMRTFVRSHPGDLISRLRLGIMLFAEEEHDEAEEHFEAALQIGRAHV